MRKIGILGGTFDPPHMGHLVIAEEVRLALSLDEVWFVPTNEPPHKEKAMTATGDRVNMLEKAIRSNVAFKVNTIEVERSGKSYTIDTMKELTNCNPEVVFYFIIGADMVESLPNWIKINELMDLVTFVGVKRAGYQLHSNYPMIQVEIPLIDISSTLIRNRLNNNQSVNYLIPEEVYTYIKERQLYGKN